MRPVTLRRQGITLRALRRRDELTWDQVRRENRDWLIPWEATAPPGNQEPPVTFSQLVRRERRQWAAESGYPWVILADGELVGRVSISGVRWGAERGGSAGYWISRSHAGQGIVPMAVAMATQFVFGRGVHRIEIAVRPENDASLRVVDKLGFRDEGLRRSYLHIDGGWRDHRVFALTQGEPRTGRYWTG